MEMEYSDILHKGIYVEEKHYEQRGIVVFDDNQLDTKHVDYEKLLSHLIENITKALNISSQNKVPGTFALFIHLNPNRKHSINKRSLLNMITVLNSLYKKMVASITITVINLTTACVPYFSLGLIEDDSK